MTWADHLDAVEEWVRQVDSGLSTGRTELPPVPTAPATRLPPDLALRTRTTLLLVDDLIGSATRRRSELDRKRAYAQL